MTVLIYCTCGGRALTYTKHAFANANRYEWKTLFWAMLNTPFILLISYARAGVQAFLSGETSFIGCDTPSHDAWLPPLTADLLLQPHLGLFPFPSYFSKLHEFLAAFYHSGR